MWQENEASKDLVDELVVHLVPDDDDSDVGVITERSGKAKKAEAVVRALEHEAMVAFFESFSYVRPSVLFFVVLLLRSGQRAHQFLLLLVVVAVVVVAVCVHIQQGAAAARHLLGHEERGFTGP